MFQSDSEEISNDRSAINKSMLLEKVINITDWKQVLLMMENRLSYLEETGFNK